MEYFTAALCVAVCILIFTKLYSTIIKLVRRQSHLYKLASKFRGPPCLPIIGNAHLFIGNTEEMMTTFYKLGESYPTPFPIWMGHLHVFFALATPEQIKVVCGSSKNIEKSMIFDFAQVIIGTGILTASAAKWRVHRKLVDPTFHLQILQSFVKVFASRAVKIAAKMEQNLNGPEFRLFHYLSQFALPAICETTMGVNLDEENNCHEYAEAIENVCDTIVRRAARPWMYPNFIFHRTQLGRDQKKNVECIHTFTDNVIQKKKKEILERGNRSDSNAEGNDDRPAMSRRQVFLDHFLNPSDDSKALSDEELRDEVNTLVVAGSDTTAAGMGFVMLMLASHPEVQEKVYEELCAVHGDDDSEDLNITGENLKRMTYLERVIKETMRLFPIVPYIARRVTEDFSIGEHIIPKGSQVMLAIFNVHRNEKYWPDPTKFDPDRFLPQEAAKQHPYTYLPFSAGIRNCIGAKYAMLSMKTFVATVVWKYILKKDIIVPVQDIRLKLEFMLKTVDPISLRIEKRIRKNAFVGISCTKGNDGERLR